MQHANYLNIIAKRTIKDQILLKSFYEPNAQTEKFLIKVRPLGPDQRCFAQPFKRFENRPIESQSTFRVRSCNEGTLFVYVGFRFRKQE